MIELIQFPWSPFCIVQRRVLEFSEAPFKIVNVPNQERSLVWKLTKQRYYGVPIIRDGKNVIFEINDDSQVVAKYLDAKLSLGLFPEKWRDIQSILWRYAENEIEGATFRLNDIYYKENVPTAEQLQFLRFKERKFGRGCIEQWRKDQRTWLKQLEARLLPFEMMLTHQPFCSKIAALFGFRPLRDARKFSLLRPSPVAQASQTDPAMASAHGASDAQIGRVISKPRKQI
jgi:glutathione S-transferase